MKQGQKSWEYTHKDYASSIVHAFSPSSKKLASKPILKQKLATIQQVECNNHLQSSVINIYNERDMSWLQHALAMGYRHVVFWFDGCWPSNADFESQLTKQIDTWNSIDDRWIVSGQILHTADNYPKFNNSFVVINLINWKLNEQIHAYTEITELREFEAIDVGYCNSLFKVDPLDGNSSQPIQQYIQQLDNFAFSSWLSWSIAKDIVVWGASDALSDCAWYVDPYLDTHQFEQGLTGKYYDRDLVSREGKYVIDKMVKPSSPVYFVNTESASPITVPELVDTEFEQYVGVTSGFKLLYYAYKYGVNPGSTDFVWFDFDAHSCAFKRETLWQWDGTDYPTWVEAWCERNPEANKDLLPMVSERWPDILQQFGGEESFKHFWTQVGHSNHTIVQVDIVNNCNTLIDKIKNKRSFVWTSNIYSYILPTLISEPFTLETSFTALMQKLQITHKDTWFCGTDTQDNDIMCPVSAITSATQNENKGYEQ